ncbi:MAG: hypothetical protein GY796_25530 [Chloroflexi bacterium]|nr:hypothetical protein [Chloroflexota bacterium]
MSSTSYKHRSSRKGKAKKGLARLVYLIIALFLIGLVVGGFALRSSQTTQASTSQYAGIPGPDDWTAETTVQIYNRSNGQWELMTYGDVGPDMEFIVGNYLYATTPGKGSLFLKPEIDISLLAETDRAFNPDSWRMPKPDDVVFLFKSLSGQQKGHWLLKHVQSDSEIVFQGKVWKWELDVENQRFVVSDTGNVFARVTETHANFHEDDVLALTVKFDSCGKTDIITGSEEHPFYVLDVEDYISMVDLQPEMRLKTDNGSLATVVELKSLDESMELYNLTVEHVHNYYIFTSEDDPGVLVHNTGPCGKVPLLGGGTDLPDGVQWGNVNQLEHPPWNPPTGQAKLEGARENLANGFDPNHALGVIIEPDGRMIVAEGNHRLFVASVEMGYDEIPIRILLDKR